MSHYDCRECGAGPYEQCECRKDADKKRRAYWIAQAASYKDAYSKVRSMIDAKDEEDSDRAALEMILELAASKIEQAVVFAAANY